jgi:galactose mutarotase-like enzyme
MSDPFLSGVRLSDPDAALQATFLPGAGMLCCSLRHRGEELLAQNAGVAAYARDGKTMGIPLLYPWANRLAAFEYTVDGRTIAVPHDPSRVALDDNGLPIHGVIAARLEWEVADATGVEVHSLAARASWSDARPDLFEVFPFRHDLEYEARLHEGRLEIELGVHACGSDAVPVAFGFHPYLVPSGSDRAGWLVELPAMRRLELDAEQIPCAPADAEPARSFELAARAFDDGFDSVLAPARFAVTAGGRRVGLELLEGYPCAQVFAPPGARFICFEPMTAPANALRSGAGLRLLRPGERHRSSFAVSVSDVR